MLVAETVELVGKLGFSEVLTVTTIHVPSLVALTQKTSTHRTSMLSRSGAVGGALGSRKAVCSAKVDVPAAALPLDDARSP